MSIILKFGGSSIKNVKKINDIINIISNQYDLDTKLIIVFSAFGDITDKLTNILDQIYLKRFKKYKTT